MDSGNASYLDKKFPGRYSLYFNVSTHRGIRGWRPLGWCSGYHLPSRVGHSSSSLQSSNPILLLLRYRLSLALPSQCRTVFSLRSSPQSSSLRIIRRASPPIRDVGLGPLAWRGWSFLFLRYCFLSRLVSSPPIGVEVNGFSFVLFCSLRVGGRGELLLRYL